MNVFVLYRMCSLYRMRSLCRMCSLYRMRSLCRMCSLYRMCSTSLQLLYLPIFVEGYESRPVGVVDFEELHELVCLGIRVRVRVSL